MTRLTIIPNVEKKRLTFDGRIASGEHVELRVLDFADKIEEGRLRVRAVDFHGNTLAMFPVKSRDENGDVKKDENGNDVWEQWGVDEDYGYATCVFNLNTIPALKYLRRGGECLIVLDDPELKTLYGSGHLCVMPWPKEIGKDEPVDLDSYPDNIRDFVRRLDDAEDNVENCRRDVESALSFASNANTNANTAASIANNALAASSEAKTSAGNALEDSAAAKKAAQDAEGLVSAAQNAAQDAKNSVAGLAEVARSGSYNDLSDKPQIPSIEGLARKADVDHVENVLRGELNGEISRAMDAEEVLETAVGGKADVTALASERQRAEAAENDLRARIAALKSFDVKVVDALPISGISNTVYLVPSRKSANLNVRDEYLWLDGAWEQIGSTSVDLTDYAKKSELPRRPEDIGAQNALNPSQLAAVNSGITADKVAKMALKEDVPTKTSDLENDSNFAADVLERTCVHEFPGGSVQACSGARVSATEWRFTDYENVVGIGQHYLLFSDGVWDFGKFSASGERMSMETVSAPFDAESLDFGAFGNVVFSGVDDMVARSGQIPKAYVKDASKSADGKTLTLTKQDGTTVSFQVGGGGGAVDSVNGKTGAVELTGADIATSAEDEKTVADSLAAKADEFTEWELEDKTLHFVSLPTFDGSDQWYCTIQDQSGNNNDCYALGGNDEINLSFFGDAIESADATRKRVLRAGDAPTSEQFSEVSSKVDDIKSAVSTNNRFLVNDTTAAIQTHDAETDKWTDEIRVDKGYDAVTGSTMVKLDKSVQTVTVSGGSLTVELPDAVDGTVRDLCLYVNNTSPTATVTMAFPASVTVYKSKGGDDPKAAAQAGGITAYYFTEIPGGAWRVMRDELEVAT